MEADDKLRRPLLFALFLVLAISIFGVPLLLSDSIELVYRIIVCVTFAACAIALHRSMNLSKYFPVFLAFFIASLVYLFEHLLFSNQSLLYWVSSSRMDLYVLFKVLSTLLVVVPIMLLTKASGQ